MREVSVLVPPAPPPLTVTEAQFQRLITDLAEYAGWKVHYETDSRASRPGFPDLWLAKRDHRLRVWELKTQRGRLRQAQREWGWVLVSVPGIDYAVVRPSDWAYVVWTLTEARD